MWDWISKNLVWIIPIAGIIITIIGRIIKFVHLWNKNKTNKEALEIEKNKAKSLEENTIISLAKLGLNLEEKRKVDLGLPLEIERIHAYFPESNECDLSNKDGSFSRELIVSLKLINNSNNSIIIKDIFISDDNPLIFKENACTFESFKDKMRSLTNKIGSLFMENEQEYIEKMYDDESYVLHLEFIGTELNPILRENPTAKRTEEKTPLLLWIMQKSFRTVLCIIENHQYTP
ncbi:hypothetical protein [Bartonella sp. DGB2]|uniref:hypothetical protein n=1 Tax=Bartonella sp. DGB2 TaxID=3388426 RepID=UPI0039902ACE